MTTFTDYLLTALGLLFSVKLWRLAGRQRQTSLRFWAFGFLASAAAAALGGTFHGFVPGPAVPTQSALWNTALYATIYLIGIGNGFMLAGALAASIHRGSRSLRWLLSGLAVSLAGVGIQLSGLDLHRHFNHSDLYHVVQMVAFYLFYRGARLVSN